ncbi:MAG TPA: hypothetical protein VHA56_18830 [Mucilaginibacter sp.]|nr:hypothetical protein [Mucilaginibacter sp.]
MCWFNSHYARLIVLAGCIALCNSSCRPGVRNNGGGLKYFDIKGYFAGEISRLNRENSPVLKTVKHNGTAQSKKVSIKNWEQELESFTSADINKPAWKDSYTITTGDSITIYKAKEPDLKVREIMIKKTEGKVKWLAIYTRTRNMLYQNIEKLSYYPDSLYLIEKGQHVRFIGDNNYTIRGLLQK